MSTVYPLYDSYDLCEQGRKYCLWVCSKVKTILAKQPNTMTSIWW